jgi:hypothetical protein
MPFGHPSVSVPEVRRDDLERYAGHHELAGVGMPENMEGGLRRDAGGGADRAAEEAAGIEHAQALAGRHRAKGGSVLSRRIAGALSAAAQAVEEQVNPRQTQNSSPSCPSDLPSPSLRRIGAF